MNEVLINCAGLLVDTENILGVMIVLSLDNLSISKTQIPRILFPM